MRRTVPALAVMVLLLAGAGGGALPATAATDEPGVELTLLATSDVHGRVLDWDYFAQTPGDIPEDTLGLSLLASTIEEVRAAEGAESVVLLDNGDAIQGTPLTELYGLAEPVTESGVEHPMATAFNYLGYDAQVVGNHEYDYGLDLLEAYSEDLVAPLLGANVIDLATGEPYHQPYTLIDRTIDGEEVTVGVLGLVTPALQTFAVDELAGRLELTDVVAAAQEWVPAVREAGADVVVVLAHSGEGTVPSSSYDPADRNEDVVSNLATLVPGIDVIVQGHTHRDMPSRVYDAPDGGRVIVTQPYYWARGLSEVSLTLRPDGEDWAVDWSAGNEPTARARYAHEAAGADAGFVAALSAAHEAAIAYVERIYEPVAPSTELMRSRTSRYEDTAILDFVNHVQTEAVRAAIAGTAAADLPIVSQASPLTRTAVFPEGMVTTGHIAGLYIYANTLDAVEVTGTQLRDYLENAARYFVQVAPGAELDPATGTNADGIGDYNYDAISGVEYVIDISRPAGERIVLLRHRDGIDVADDDRFVLALNDFRRTGSGGYPHVAQAPVLHTGDTDIRELLVAWAADRGVIDPADFFVENWRLVSTPLELPTDAPTDLPTEEPTSDADPTEPSPTEPATTPPPTAAPAAPSGELPATGAGLGSSVGAVALLLVLGLAALGARRRAL
ncbi:bifunctional metallophosphatase/5'-nucleotidase [Georgenia sunbinii]|uniref:bifunctional metallophosphatase/5'-nucleotidase n=1 Tax=Georgenia sunbinii TaxID=3117728 RepID=UPI002F26426C